MALPKKKDPTLLEVATTVAETKTSRKCRSLGKCARARVPKVAKLQIHVFVFRFDCSMNHLLLVDVTDHVGQLADDLFLGFFVAQQISFQGRKQGHFLEIVHLNIQIFDLLAASDFGFIPFQMFEIANQRLLIIN
jgi:hypothetical protein